MGRNDVLFPGAHNERLKQKASPHNRALASAADLQQVSAQAGIAVGALHQENRKRQQEIAEWGGAHLLLLRVLVRKGIITEPDLLEERAAMRAEWEAAEAAKAAQAEAPAVAPAE